MLARKEELRSIYAGADVVSEDIIVTISKQIEAARCATSSASLAS
jgi:hypothetical protein